GQGFYDYPKDAKKHLWKEWSTIYPSIEAYDEEEVGRRLLFAMVIDSYKCLDSSVLKEAKDADIGSILGIGFPIHTGGVMSYIDYIGDRKSTRLNSSHVKISYAVFCLKKKNKIY